MVWGGGHFVWGDISPVGNFWRGNAFPPLLSIRLVFARRRREKNGFLPAFSTFFVSNPPGSGPVRASSANKH